MKKRIWIAVLVLVIDRITKLAAPSAADPITLIPGVIGLRYCLNTGAAFSMFSGMPWLLGILSLILIAAGCVILRRYKLGAVSMSAAMLMLGGAVGNAIDRLLFGAVTDMFEVLLFRFAVFNAADAALTVGCVLMAVSLLFCPREWRPREDA